MRAIFLNGFIIADRRVYGIDVILKACGDLRDHKMIANLLYLILWRRGERDRIIVKASPFVCDSSISAICGNLKGIAARGKAHRVANRSPPTVLV